MEIDWGFAAMIGGVGFGIVFVVLIALAVTVWLAGLIIGKAEAGKKAGDDKKGA